MISGTNTASVVIALDKMSGVDLFPMSGEEFAVNMLDHADVLVFPDAHAGKYEKLLVGNVRLRIAEFTSRGGKVLGWGEGAKHVPEGGEKFDSAASLLARLAELAK